MGFGLRQELRASQRLVLTPALRGALEILALPVLELEQIVVRIASENPFLELESWPEGPVVGWEDLRQVSAYQASEAGEGEENEQERGPLLRRRSLNEIETGATWPDAGADTVDPVADIPAPWPCSLYAYLHWQLDLEPLPASVVMHARIIIDALDPCGFLTEDIEQIAARARVEPKHLAEALEVVRRLDPPGVGARDARECLLLQLRRRREEAQAGGSAWRAGSAADIAERILAEFADLLVQRRGSLQRLARELQVSLHDLGAALDLLRTLRPFPAAELVSEPVPVAQPDLTVQRAGDGSLNVWVNGDALPKVRFRREYARRVMRELTDPREREAVRKWLEEARWVEQGLIRRNLTLQRLGEVLLVLQPEFFAAGPRYLRPMRLDDVAARLHLHKSTVSRAIRGKYIQTPHGMFPLASLFSAGLDSRGEESAISARVVKERIRALIAGEDSARPFSDAFLQKILEREGVRISRRTVAKYRAELGIPPCHRRVGRGKKG